MFKSSTNQAIILALIAAVVSGAANFVNKFAVKSFSDPFVFTTLKNLLVALALFLVLFRNRDLVNLKNTASQFRPKLARNFLWIALIGGSVPFLLFFYGLSLTSAVSASFIHKTLFIWVAILSAFYLTEKPDRKQLLALVFLFTAVWLANGFKWFKFNWGDGLVLVATLMWSVEYILVKKTLVWTNYRLVVGARMIGGSLIMILFLLISGRWQALNQLNLIQIYWLAVTSLILLAFVLTWYKALSLAPASLVTIVLTIAAPITAWLNFIWSKQIDIWQILSGLALALAVSWLISLFKNRHYAAKSQSVGF